MWMLLWTACIPCGHYEVSGTTATNFEGMDYDGRWRESCGFGGSSAVWDLANTGIAEIWFDPDKAGKKSWMGIDFELEVGFPQHLLVPGTTITPADGLFGGAAINPCVDCPQDLAGLTDGTLEIGAGWEGEDPCEPEDGPSFRVRWDLEWGDPAGPHYTAVGGKKLTFSTFTTDACGWF